MARYLHFGSAALSERPGAYEPGPGVVIGVVVTSFPNRLYHMNCKPLGAFPILNAGIVRKYINIVLITQI